jgi:YegS/Rv2252/BmrU family lipid kinase
MRRHVYVVANPAAGQSNFDIRLLNARFNTADIEWEVLFTKGEGDADRLTRQALDEGADVVAAYGGDGTVAEVGGAMLNSGIPLAILPGGTANVMSVELGIPQNFGDAVGVLCNGQLTLRPIDVGKVDDRHFILRVSMGLEARMVEGADRTLKDRFGSLAYALSALKAIAAPELLHFEFTIDGQSHSEEGIACVIANSANLGRAGMQLSPDVNVADGLLDIFVLNNASVPTVMSLLSGILAAEPKVALAEELGAESSQPRPLHHWQAKEVVVQSTPVSSVQCDGEMIGETPMKITILPAALQIVTPPPAPQTNTAT